MSLSQVKLSESDALAMIQAAHPGYVTPTQMMQRFNVSASVTNRMMQRLESKGQIERVYNASGRLRAFFIDPAARADRAAAEQALADSFVKPFKTNIWTKPLSGYERSLRDAAARAVAGR